jgi:DNA polymerase-3 subunit gamma/tau
MSVVGQRSLTTTLKNAITGNHLAHAYLFCGPRGVGKTTCARIFAKTINCLNRTTEGEACNECESCKSFNEQRSYNIHELDAASNNSVEDIRTLIDQVRIPPQIGKYSVYIIDEVHMLSQQAFNAFLKTLEEPPAHAIFILATTEKHKIIPTILSRCQIYDFNRIGIKDTVEHLAYIASQEGVTAEAEALNVIAQKADGGMRDALSIFDQIVSYSGNNITYKAVIENLNVLDYEYYFKLTDAFLANNVAETMLIFNEILNKGFEAQHFITGLSSHFRDLLMCKDMATVKLIEVGANIKERYLTQSQQCLLEFLYKAIEIANECDLNYRFSRNKRLLVELCLIRISQLSDSKKKIVDTTEEKEKPVIEPIFQAPQSSAAPQQTTSVQPARKEVTVSTPQVSVPKTVPNPTLLRSISISINPQKENATKQENISIVEEPAAVYSSSFSSDDLHAAWAKMIASLNADVHIIKAIEKAILHWEQGNSFVLKLGNSLQEKNINDLKGDILTFLRNELKNSDVNFTTQVEENIMKKPVTNQDRLKEMIDKNENFRRLASELSLEV